MYFNKTPCNIVKILWESIEAQQRTAIARRLNLKFAPPPNDLPFALTDAGALRQIVSSLIENAIKYTPEGGEIVITASRKNERIATEVSDNGCGVAAEDLPRIFEKFYRGRPLEADNKAENAGEFLGEDEYAHVNETAGVGLGLYLVHNLVEQIGGEIIAESPVDKSTCGTKFTVLLPNAK